MWRIVCDLMLSFQMVFVNGLEYVQRHHPAALDENSFWGRNSSCSEPLAFVLQFGLFGSLAWYACLSANLYLTVTRPFTRPASRTPLYHWGVWAGSAVTGMFAAGTHGYRPLYHLCWTRREPAHAHNWLLLFGWVLLFSVLSTLVLLYCQAILLFGGSQLQHRLRPRLAQLRASRLYTAAFSLYWGGVGALYAYMYMRFELQGHTRSEATRFTFAALLGLMGCCDAVVWVGVQAAVQPGALRDALSGVHPLSILRRLSPVSMRRSTSGVAPHAARLKGRSFTISDSMLAIPLLQHAYPVLPVLPLGAAPADNGDGCGCGCAGGGCGCAAGGCGCAAGGCGCAGCGCAGAGCGGCGGGCGDGGGGGAACSPHAGSAVRGSSGAHDEWREDDLSDSLRRDFVRHTIVGVVSSTRTVESSARWRELDAARRAAEAPESAAPCSSPCRTATPTRHTPTRRRVAYEPLAPSPPDATPLLPASVAPLARPAAASPAEAAASHAAAPAAPGAAAAPNGGASREQLPLPRSPCRGTAAGRPCGGVQQRTPPSTPTRARRAVSALRALLPGAAPTTRAARGSRLEPLDFSEVSSHELAPGVQFQDFAPLVWQVLRHEVYGVTCSEYTASLAGDSATQLEACIEAMVGQFSEGGGGGFFFFSSDGRYLLKTLAPREQRELLRILPAYVDHLQRSPRTLLSRLYGCYAITMHGQTRGFAVMSSLFHGVSKIHEKYDLKGSWVGRSMRGMLDSDREADGARRPEATIPAASLDNDLARKVRLPRRLALQLAAQCARDAELLRGLNIMDFSMLLGVRLVAPAAPAAAGGASCPATVETGAAGAAGAAGAVGGTEAVEPSPSRAGPLVWTSEDGTAEYYVTIIDLLQSWNLRKRLERLFKLAVYCRWWSGSADGISAVEPAQYARRFNLMVARILALDKPRGSQRSTPDDSCQRSTRDATRGVP